MFDLAFRFRRCFISFVLFVVLSPAALAQPADDGTGKQTPIFGKTLEIEGETRKREVGKRKVDPDLWALQSEFLAHLAAGATARAYSSDNPAMRVVDGFVVMDTAASEDPEQLQADLRQLGMIQPVVFGRMVSGRFPIAAMEALEALDSLRLARPAYAMTNAGTVTSQADAAVNADEVRALFGIDGSGVTVGTLSDSYDCFGDAATDVTNNDLPAGVNVLEEISGCDGAIDEGRAMMQLIHDLTPGADQAFHSAFNGMASFAQGILDLAAAGSDVIVDDIIYFAEPMFQDGVVAQAVDTVAGQGVAYFSSAGNSSRNSYESEFRSSGITEFSGDAHDFDPGEDADIYQNITVPSGATLTLTLQWDSPFFSVSGAPGSPNDVDIYLTDDPPTGVVLAQSISNNLGGDPVEILQFTNSGGSSTSFNIVIELFDGPAPGLIKYVVLGGGTINEFDTDSSTVYGHANAAGAVAVGASAYFETPEFGQSPPLLEPFSSAGPTPILFDLEGNPVNISRQKPEIVCVDGTNTTFFGSDIDGDGFPNFFGTSAAAPHAAAIAALMLDVESTLTPALITDALVSGAIDMGDVGVDDDSGAGLCQADTAVAAIASGTISVMNTVSPTSVDEPGDSPTFTLRIDNTGNVDVEINSLDDDVNGNLDGQGTCFVPQVIGVGDFFQCDYTASVSGNAGDSPTGTTTASGTSPVGVVSDADAATVTINDVLPAISVTRTALKSSVAEPGDNVTFITRVENDSVENVDLISLVDGIHGDLNGQGTCGVPQTIVEGGFYECAFSAFVGGSPGDSETALVTATAADDENNTADAADSVTVTVTDVLPSIEVSYAVSPTEVEAPGGVVDYTIQIDSGSAAEGITLTSLFDSEFGDLNGRGSCSLPELIAPEGTYQCSFAAQVNGDAGTIQVNTLTAVVEDDEENTASGDAQASVGLTALFKDGFETP